MNFFSICGVSLIAAFLSELLRESGSKTAPYLSIAAGVLVFLSLIGGLRELLSALFSFAERAGVSETVETSLRAVGIGLLTEETSGICRDLGESHIACRLEAAGRLSVTLLAFPTFLSLLEIAVGSLG